MTKTTNTYATAACLHHLADRQVRGVKGKSGLERPDMFSAVRATVCDDRCAPYCSRSTLLGSFSQADINSVYADDFGSALCRSRNVVNLR